ncbi:MAG: DsbA family protein [bacterium]
MEEVTIKINKTALFLVAGLIVGAGLGYYAGANRTPAVAKNPGGTQVVANNQPSPADSGSAPAEKIIVTKDDNITGAKNPQVYLVEFSDFQCPYCKKFHPTMQQIIKEFGNKVAWVYRHFPLSSQQNAQIAAEASECASEQGKFWEYGDLLFAKGSGDGTGLTPPDLEKYARDLGLNGDKFDSCLASKKYAGKVGADQVSGSAAGVNGTPGTVLIDKNGNQNLISGAVSYEELKTAIQAALQ